MINLAHLVSRKRKLEKSFIQIFLRQFLMYQFYRFLMSQQPTILVVDQSLHDLEFVNSCLKSLNVTCISTKEGARTLVLAKLHKPSIIFLDTTLNDLNSSKVVKYLRSNVETSKIPIVGCIPAKTQQNIDRLVISGVNDYIRKPYDVSKIEASVNHFLGWEHSCV
ncbi:two-component system response regulator [Brunnivagina elsteri CCALA 953]|uniref:Two-component system response regulator n=2 Tax=Brunnivagina TaxID=3344733 RepID=A0A2A2TGF4_9CYAN|nr:two-component system response regulator [Calothrix elsteri CCALA 953]